MVLVLGGPDGLAQLRAEILLIKVPPLLAMLLLPAMDPTLRQIPLPYAAVLVGLWLPVLRSKRGAQEDSLQLPAHVSVAIRLLPGLGLLLPEGLLPVLQVGLQLQYQGSFPGQLALLLPSAAPPCGRFLGLRGRAGDLWPTAGLDPGLVPPAVLVASSSDLGPAPFWEAWVDDHEGGRS